MKIKRPLILSFLFLAVSCALPKDKDQRPEEQVDPHDDSIELYDAPKDDQVEPDSPEGDSLQEKIESVIQIGFNTKTDKDDDTGRSAVHHNSSTNSSSIIRLFQGDPKEGFLVGILTVDTTDIASYKELALWLDGTGPLPSGAYKVKQNQDENLTPDMEKFYQRFPAYGKN